MMRALYRRKILWLFPALMLLGIFQPFNVSAQNLLENMKQQDFYGKVVDQNGQPVVQANVIGYLRFDEGFGINDEKVEVFKTQTDAGGLFQFTGLHGARFGQKVSKDGYEMRDEAYVKQAGPKTSPNDRATFMMWKLRGAESMTHNEFESRIPYDGTPAEFDLTTGMETDNGDFKITLSRSPLKIRRGRDKYNWTLKVEMATGGLMPENDPYPYWAPDMGYKSFFQTSMSSNEVPWSAEFRQDFYFKSSQNIYGRLFIDLSTDSMRPDTGISIEAWVNPSGSRNLESDPK
jgi:hypothetical protein